jgi:hypothetical protein
MGALSRGTGPPCKRQRHLRVRPRFHQFCRAPRGVQVELPQETAMIQVKAVLSGISGVPDHARASHSGSTLSWGGRGIARIHSRNVTLPPKPSVRAGAGAASISRRFSALFENGGAAARRRLSNGPRSLAPVFCLQLGLPFVGSNCRACFDGFFHLGSNLDGELKPFCRHPLAATTLPCAPDGCPCALPE